MEIIWTSSWNALNGDIKLTGTTYGWMFPIYGMAIFLENIHDAIRGQLWYVRGFFWVIIIYTIEYITGWVLQQILGICPWDYSGSRYNIHGLIRLDFAPAWFMAGLIFERIHDYFNKILPYHFEEEEVERQDQKKEKHW